MDMDAFLLVSYGAPECRSDVKPFIRNVVRGKNVPEERIAEVAAHYDRLAMETGSFSPLPDECRALIAGMLDEFPRRGQKMPVYWGNLFWHPLLTDTVAEMVRDGIKNVVAFPTSAFPSAPGNRRYRDALDAACKAIGSGAPSIRVVPPFCEHPLFLEAVADRVFEALAHLELEPEFKPCVDGPRTRIVFTAHSLPETDAVRTSYTGALEEACRGVMEYIRLPIAGLEDGPIFPSPTWELVYQSRSGSPRKRWLRPDIDERIETLAAEGRYTTLLFVPIGFFCENMETVYDLDRSAADLCERHGLRYARARVVGAGPKTLSLIYETVTSLLRDESPPFAPR